MPFTLRPYRPQLLAPFISIACFAITAAAAGRDSATLWLAPVDGAFNDPARWSAGVPGNGTSAQFGAVPGGPFTVSLGGAQSMSALRALTQSVILDGSQAPGALLSMAALQVDGAQQLTLRQCALTCTGAVSVGYPGETASTLVIEDGATLIALNALGVGSNPDALLDLAPLASLTAKSFGFWGSIRWRINGSDACFVHVLSELNPYGTIRIAFGPNGPPPPGSVIALADNPSGCDTIPATVIIESNGQMIDGVVAVEDEKLVYRQLVEPLQIVIDLPPIPSAGFHTSVDITGLADGRAFDLARQATLTSSDSNIVQIAAPGQIIGLAPGRATLTATVGSNSESIEVIVGEQPIEFVAADAGVCTGSKAWGASRDGRFVLFQALGASGYRDVFVRDLETGDLENLNQGPDGQLSSGDADGPSISGDGRFVSFRTHAPEVIGVPNVTVIKDRVTGSVEFVATAPDGSPVGGVVAMLSYDGRYVVFNAEASLLDPELERGSPHVFIRDRLLETITHIGIGPNGAALPYSVVKAITSDARYVAMGAWVDGRGSSLEGALLVRDLMTGVTTIEATEAEQFDPFSGYPIGMSDDAHSLTFQLGGYDSENNAIVVRDRLASTTTVIDALGFMPEPDVAMSPNGRYVGYHKRHWETCGSLLLSGGQDVWRYDVVLGTHQRVNERSGAQADGETFGPITFSEDGRFCTFWTSSDDLLPTGSPCARVLRRRFGPVNGADIDGDGVVNTSDLALLLAAWGTSEASADLDGNGLVGPHDLAILLGAWSGR